MSLPPVRECREGYVSCAHRVDPRFLNSNGLVFGGNLSPLVDDFTGHATMTVMPDAQVGVTSELSVSYFRPCRPEDGDLLLEGLVINQSRRLYHVEAIIKRADGKLVAEGHAIIAISDRER